MADPHDSDPLRGFFLISHSGRGHQKRRENYINGFSAKNPCLGQMGHVGHENDVSS